MVRFGGKRGQAVLFVTWNWRRIENEAGRLGRKRQERLRAAFVGALARTTGTLPHPSQQIDLAALKSGRRNCRMALATSRSSAGTGPVAAGATGAIEAPILSPTGVA